MFRQKIGLWIGLVGKVQNLAVMALGENSKTILVRAIKHGTMSVAYLRVSSEILLASAAWGLRVQMSYAKPLLSLFQRTSDQREFPCHPSCHLRIVKKRIVHLT